MEMHVMVPFVMTLVVIVVGFIWWKKQQQKGGIKVQKYPTSSVPGLKPSHAKLGNLEDIKKAGSLLQFLLNLHNEFGSLASYWMGEEQVVSIASPELFKQHSKHFDRALSTVDLLEPLITKYALNLINGPDAKKRHSAYERCYHYEYFQDYIGILDEIVEDLNKEWCDAAENQKSLPLQADCYNVTIKAITRTSFGELFQSDKDLQKLLQHFNIMLKEVERRMLEGVTQPTDSSGELRKNREALLHLARKAMELRSMTSDTSRRMVIDVIMDSELSEEAKLADMLNILIAGFHSTGLFMTWCFYFLAKHQDVQDRVAKELKEVLQEEPVSIHNMSELVYLRQVLDETLRVTAFTTLTSRICDEETLLGGYTIPPKMPVIHALGVTMKDPQLWPDPERFDPDRFSPQNRRKMPHHCFEPFGFAGGRKCLGSQFAYLEVTFVVATIIRNLIVKLVDKDSTIKPVYGLLANPNDTIMVKFVKR